MRETTPQLSSGTRKKRLLEVEEEDDEEQRRPLIIRRRTPSKPEQQLALVVSAPKKFNFRVLLPNDSKAVNLRIEDPDMNMSVAEFIRLVRRKVNDMEAQTGKRRIRWGPHMSLEDALGYKLEDGRIFPANPDKKPMTLVLHDGDRDTIHFYEDMWDVTPDPNVLGGMPQDYTIETALADLIDNSLQAVWANKQGERRLISIEIGNHEISIFDSGQGMDSSEKNSIANWGTMGSSIHKDVRSFAIGLRPPYLKPFFGMYGCGGVLASLYLGGLVTVSSKTKSSKRVVTLRLEKDVIMGEREPEKIWRTPGTIRDMSEEERMLSPHESFTKVHISKLKSNYWNEHQLKCLLKDIYFPYIQNDGLDESLQTSTPVEFEVNGTNLTEVEGGEAVITNLAACNGPKFVVEIHLTHKMKAQDDMSSESGKRIANTANARLSCLYFPIIQGKESTDQILEKLNEEAGTMEKRFETFCHVSVRRLGRLLPDARWDLFPFMKPPKPKRGEKPKIPTQCYQRVKCYVETDAGFVPTPNKTDLCHNEPFTKALTCIGRYWEHNEIILKSEREGRVLSPAALTQEYQEWLKAVHESYDEEVECVDEQPTLLVNPANWKDFGFSSSSTEYGSANNVVRVLRMIRRKGEFWKSSQRVRIHKGAYCLRKDLYATLEHILCQGLEGDPGETRMICRPIECPEEDGSKIIVVDNNVSFDLGSSVSYPIELIHLGKCQKIDEAIWNKKKDNMQMKAPSFIDLLDREEGSDLAFFKVMKEGSALEAGFVLPKEIIAVVRPNRCTIDWNYKESDKLNQKYIFKECMEMALEIKALSDCKCHEDCSHGIVKFKMLSKATSRNQINGLYCFSMEGNGLSEMFRQAGKYRLIFSLENRLHSHVNPAKRDILVEASKRIGKWKLSTCLFDTGCEEIPRPDARLGSSVGPIYVSCFDTYSNQIKFEHVPLVCIQVVRDGVKVPIIVQIGHAQIIEDKMYLHYKEILLRGGDITVLRPSFEASLRISSDESSYAEMPIRILPGKANSVRIFDSEKFENLAKRLHPGDILPDLHLQALDAYGNPVEKGQRLKIELMGLQFQDKDSEIREVDEEGCLNLGGLLKVIGKYGSMAYIHVSSESQILLQKQFKLLERELKILSKVPEKCHAGSMLRNIEFAIFNEKGEIDPQMSGCNHTLIINLENEDAIQYTFKDGKCKVSNVQLPNECGPIEFTACHALHPELSVVIKIDLLPKPSMEMVCGPKEDLKEWSQSKYKVIAQASLNSPVQAQNSIPIDIIDGFMGDISEWQQQIKQQGVKVEQLEEAFHLLKNRWKVLDNSLDSYLKELKKYSSSFKADSRGRPINSSHSIEETLQEIKRHKASASAIWVDFSMKNKQSHPILKRNVVGVVALLGKVENDTLNYVLSEYIGTENMLAIVCKTKEAVEALEQYDHMGKVDTRAGIHSLASEQNLQIIGRFRVICLEDIGFYTGEFKDDPEEKLIIDDPRLENGDIPNGFIGYAVNMIQLDDKSQYLSNASAGSLRRSLFFHLFSYLQVYKTRTDMMHAASCIKAGAVSLDGGMLKSRGVAEYGRSNSLSVRFPTTYENMSSSYTRFALEAKIRETTEERKEIEAELDRVSIKLQKEKQRFGQKREEFSEKQKKAAVLQKHLIKHKPCA